MLVHCNMKFREDDILFLYDNDKFIKRKLYFATCPECGSFLAMLVQTRRSDNQKFTTSYYKQQAEKTYDKLVSEVNYRGSQQATNKQSTYGLCYGEYTEIHDKTGNITKIREKQKDFFGNTKVLKEIENNY